MRMLINIVNIGNVSVLMGMVSYKMIQLSKSRGRLVVKILD